MDHIYVINLKHRPERWATCKKQMDLYDLQPERFEGIYGWDLTAEELHDLGFIPEPWMWNSRAPMTHFPIEGHGHPIWLNFKDACGKVVFNGWMTKGAIGRTLSHLSILKEAFQAGFQTIWVMEDEVFFRKNPKILSTVMAKLDSLVGIDGWDLLYTDFDALEIDPNFDLLRQVHHMLRPNLRAFNPNVFTDMATYFTKHLDMGSHFMQITGRGGTHSIIYRRSGIEKILNFYQEHKIYNDYASDLSIIPNLRLFALKDSITSVLKTPSDADEHFFPGSNAKILSPWDRGDPWP